MVTSQPGTVDMTVTYISYTDVLSSSRIAEKTILIHCAQRTLHPFCVVSHACTAGELDNQARKTECGTLVLEPEGKWRDTKKSLYCKFKKTSLAVDASMACDQMKDLEKIGPRIVHERMSVGVHDPNFEFGYPWFAGLFGSVQQAALTRAKATLLRKAMLERWQRSKVH